ncbi:Peptide deformylase [Azospirillaceae bacterium]
MFDYNNYGLIEYPNPILRQKAEPVTVFNDDVRKKAYLMHKIMAEKGGIGLAANQIGLLERIIIIDAKLIDDHKRSYYTFVNPEILSSEGEYVNDSEGCLSHPGIRISVKRPKKIKLKYQDVDGNFHENNFESVEGNIVAQVIHHEIDHLLGVTIIDCMTPGQKMINDKKLIRLEKEYRKLKKSRQ